MFFFFRIFCILILIKRSLLPNLKWMLIATAIRSLPKAATSESIWKVFQDLKNSNVRALCTCCENESDVRQGNVCSCDDEELRSPKCHAIVIKNQDQLPRDTISRAKDCNGGLIVRYFFGDIGCDASVARRPSLNEWKVTNEEGKHIEVRDDIACIGRNTSPVRLMGVRCVVLGCYMPLKTKSCSRVTYGYVIGTTYC